MDLSGASVAPALTGSVGAFIQNDMNRSNADHAMDRSDAMAREQMAFQERMSNSAYQRATKDMRQAGINPMVAFQQGGASTPSGASGQGINAAPMQNPFSNLLSSAIDVKRLDNETRQQGSQQALNDALAMKATADAGASGASAKESAARTQAVSSQLDAIASRAKADKATADMDYKAVTYDAIAKRVNRETNSAKNVLDMFKIPNFGAQSGPRTKTPSTSGNYEPLSTGGY